jgi:hypothetical protein
MVHSDNLETWLFSIMLIENDNGRKGTGFAIRRMKEGFNGKTILIANKHVLGKEGNYPAGVKLYLSVIHNGGIQGHTLDFSLIDPEGKGRIRGYPDPDDEAIQLFESSKYKPLTT